MGLLNDEKRLQIDEKDNKKYTKTYTNNTK